ncbi:MAG: hypothetical protein GY679_03300 [Mycoplasma sp.]|nr:hypothetical protein [Mycoplasma sp.]
MKKLLNKIEEFNSPYKKKEKFKNSKEKKKDIKKIIKEIKVKGYTEDKIEKSKKIYEKLSEKNTRIAISGATGSGKTTVMELAIQPFIKKQKMNKTNLMWLFLKLYFLKIISFLFYKTPKQINKIQNKICIRRSELININLWNLFGTRDPNDYEDMKTFFIDENQKIIDYQHDFEKKENSDEFEILNLKATSLFVKKTLWKIISFKIGVFRSLDNNFKKALKWNEIGTDRKKYISPLKLLFFALLIIIPIAIFCIFFFSIDLEYKYARSIIASILTISTTILEIIFILIKPDIENKKIDDFLSDPSYNSVLTSLISKKTKYKFVILHFSELDRLHKWLKMNSIKDDFLIEKILENISFLYSVDNLNVILELNNSIISSYTGEEKNSNIRLDSDVILKLFDEIVYVNAFKINDFSKIINKTEFLNMFDIERIFGFITKNDMNSWRNIKIFNKAIKELDEYYRKQSFLDDEFKKRSFTKFISILKKYLYFTGDFKINKIQSIDVQNNNVIFTRLENQGSLIIESQLYYWNLLRWILIDFNFATSKNKVNLLNLGYPINFANPYDFLNKRLIDLMNKNNVDFSNSVINFIFKNATDSLFFNIEQAEMRIRGFEQFNVIDYYNSKKIKIIEFMQKNITTKKMLENIDDFIEKETENLINEEVEKNHKELKELENHNNIKDPVFQSNLEKQINLKHERHDRAIDEIKKQIKIKKEDIKREINIYYDNEKEIFKIWENFIIKASNESIFKNDFFTKFFKKYKTEEIVVKYKKNIKKIILECKDEKIKNEFYIS